MTMVFVFYFSVIGVSGWALTKSQRDFFTLASFLKEAGYDTSFIYGWEAHFDNMRRFFMNNGFEHVVDENDYENPVFTGSWGAQMRI